MTTRGVEKVRWGEKQFSASAVMVLKGMKGGRGLSVVMVMGGGEGNVYKTHKCNLNQVQYLLEFGVSSMLICSLTP